MTTSIGASSAWSAEQGQRSPSLAHRPGVVSGKGPYNYVALGDSYSSGEGNPPFDPGTAQTSKNGDTCHRSKAAWPRLMAAGDNNLHMLGLIACSGAKTWALYQDDPKTHKPFKNEPGTQIAELKNLHPASGTVVTITIGGNDIGFAPLFTNCYIHDCYTDGVIKGTTSKINNQLPAELATAFRLLAAAVPPRTKIVVVGYPNIITTSNASRLLHCPTWLQSDELSGLVKLGKALDQAEMAAATAAGFGYVSTLNALSGHELCTGDSWVRSVNLLKITNAQEVQEFGHPLLNGQKAIAKDVESYLQGIYPYGNGAVAVPGLAALNAGGQATVTSVSCASPGNCAAAGDYLDGSDTYQGFIADEVNGAWHAAVPVPGAAVPGEGSSVESVSCASPGNCVVGGSYGGEGDSGGVPAPFVANEVNGTWQAAVPVPGTFTLDHGGQAQVDVVACPSAGNCTASGTYQDLNSALYYYPHLFVADEVNGAWHAARQVPGTSGYGEAGDSSLSCGSAGNCVVGGYYSNGSGAYTRGFLAEEVKGTWRNAFEPAALTAVNRDWNSTVSSVSCPSAGNCTATGYYPSGDLTWQDFVLNEVNGTWSNSVHVPSLPSAGRNPNGLADSVSCWSPGNCALAGYYYYDAGLTQGYTWGEANGTWAKAAAQVPALLTLDTGHDSRATAVSCGPNGFCALAGTYQDGADNNVFVASRVGGTWHSAASIPGLAALNSAGQAAVSSVSCLSNTCAFGGDYTDSTGHVQGFVVG